MQMIITQIQWTVIKHNFKAEQNASKLRKLWYALRQNLTTFPMSMKVHSEKKWASIKRKISGLTLLLTSITVHYRGHLGSPKHNHVTTSVLSSYKSRAQIFPLDSKNFLLPMKTLDLAKTNWPNHRWNRQYPYFFSTYKLLVECWSCKCWENFLTQDFFRPSHNW